MPPIESFWIHDSSSIVAMRAFITPILGMIVLALIVWPIKWVIDKLWKDSPMKQTLFKKHYTPMEIANGMVPKDELERLEREKPERELRIAAYRETHPNDYR
jgi:hypothetical protein